MWAQVMMCLALGGTALSLQCPDGYKCEEPFDCCRIPGENKYFCCDQAQLTEVSLRMVRYTDRPSKYPFLECPDGSMCPSEYSCVQTPGYWFACCPWDKGVTCADGLHCCPKGSYCSADGHTCIQSQGTQVLTRSATVGAVQCPDHESECPNESTCCVMRDGSWGCCPMPEASCCEDKIHCCPHATTCDLEHTRCLTASGEQQPLQRKFPASRRTLTLVHNVQCDAQYQCPEGNTCCQKPSGTWGCCPLEEAVCCSDGTHCCPKGYQCNVEEGTCLKDSQNIPWLTKTSSMAASDGMERDVKCDDRSSCSDWQTCCRLPSGQWGCCPLAQAVCCTDHVHCCPSGYTCDDTHSTCIKSAHLSPWISVAPVLTTLERVVKCDDQASCPDGMTCCRLASGQWGCCVLPQAVCCPDHIHCCPSGFQCAPEQGSCLKSGVSIPWLEKTPAIPNKISLSGDVMCDDTTACPDGTTCCRKATGEWGCCPIPEAVCCTDHVHCCPSGYTCDVAHGTCTMSTHLSPWFSVTPILALLEKDVKCDDRTSCSDGQTCCRLASGQWGCCPFAQAICCQDHIHCCPSGFQCAPEQGSCLKSGVSIPWLEKTPAIPNKISLSGDVMCDDTTACPDGTTCCRKATGEWGCCPIPEAVCCTDHVHCCPSGYTCDVAHGTCTMSTHLSPWFSVTPILALLEKDVKCDDRTSCSDGQTCCRLASGQWGCCPFAQAICCQDHIHCCPSGFQCAPEQGSCLKSGVSIPWLEKTPAIPNKISLSGDVMCDDTTACPDGTTCCRKATGEWGCCPIPEAVCCTDHVHCCPSGYTCDVAHGTCTMSTHLSPWFSVTPILALLEKDVKCDDRTSCSDGQTCCRLASGQWGCCPFAQAICCQDHIHCCPSGFQCAPEQGSCLKSGVSIPWLEKTPAIPNKISLSGDVMCDDTTACPDGTTCCRKATGEWGCCPIPEAVCCTDHVHCCPSGYTCDVAHGTCTMSAHLSPWISVAPILASQERDVKCDDRTSCSDGQTCCRLASGQWGCCPFAQAVCCQDRIHCCPQGFTCNQGFCQKQQQSLPWSPKLLARATQSHAVHCNETTSCKEGQTCCKGVTGDWACCQLPNAVCCDDHQHCCPSGYTCNTAAQTCEKMEQIRQIGFVYSVPLFSSHMATLSRDVQCDPQHYCHDRQTCCQTQTGGWACCPFNKGTCCSDKRHCCPSGFRCSSSGLDCYRNGPLRWDIQSSFPRSTEARPLL